MENKIVAGPFLDEIIRLWLYLPKKRYSTNFQDSLLLLNYFVQQNPCDLNINLKKTPNTQIFKIDLNGIHSESGYFPTAVCLAIINKMVEPLKGWTLKELNEIYCKAIHAEDFYYDYGYENEELNDEIDYLNKISETYCDYFSRFNEEELEALIDYANK